MSWTKARPVIPVRRFFPWVLEHPNVHKALHSVLCTFVNSYGGGAATSTITPTISPPPPVNPPIPNPGSGTPWTGPETVIGSGPPLVGSGFFAVAAWDPTLKVWDWNGAQYPSVEGAVMIAQALFGFNGWYTIVVNDRNSTVFSLGVRPSDLP